MEGSGMKADRRTAVAVLAVVVALAAVSIAANGGAPVGSGGARRPSEWAIDVAVSLLLVVMAVGSVFAAVVLVLRPSVLGEPTTPVRKRGRLLSAGVLMVLVILLAYGVRRLVIDEDARDRAGALLPGQGTTGALGDTADRYEPSFAVLPVTVVCILAAVAGMAWLLAVRARRVKQAPDASVAEALAAVLDDTLDDLRAERDPRRAVIAAYARLERVLAAHGAPRRPSEAPDEYLRRVLVSLDLSREAVSRLTALFQTAKFSQHEVDTGMKEDAIEALVSARDELRHAEERAAAERAAALAQARERAAAG
jgi:hypothetical protein